jgi:hypothetical protein
LAGRRGRRGDRQCRCNNQGAKRQNSLSRENLSTGLRTGYCRRIITTISPATMPVQCRNCCLR